MSESRNWTLLDMVRLMMLLIRTAIIFCSYALKTVACTLNKAPSKSVEMTPYLIWHGGAMLMQYVYYKINPKTDICFLVGYPKLFGILSTTAQRQSVCRTTCVFLNRFL